MTESPTAVTWPLTSTPPTGAETTVVGGKVVSALEVGSAVVLDEGAVVEVATDAVEGAVVARVRGTLDEVLGVRGAFRATGVEELQAASTAKGSIAMARPRARL